MNWIGYLEVVILSSAVTLLLASAGLSWAVLLALVFLAGVAVGLFLWSFLLSAALQDALLLITDT